MIVSSRIERSLSVVSYVLVNFDSRWNCFCADWMECQGWFFKKYWFCSCICPCHVKVWWFKEMVGNSVLAFHNIGFSGRINQNIGFVPLYNPNKLITQLLILSYMLDWHGLDFSLQLYLPNWAGKDWTILERLVCFIFIFTFLLLLVVN